MLEHLPHGVNIIGSHSMFGPQTLTHNNHSFSGFNVVLENIRCKKKIYAVVKDFINSLGAHTIEMTADDHDQKAAKFHFLSQLVGNSLAPLCLEQSDINTVSYEFLFNFMKRLDPDDELLSMMYTYNPYSKIYLEKYKQSFDALYSKLKPYSD